MAVVSGHMMTLGAPDYAGEFIICFIADLLKQLPDIRRTGFSESDIALAVAEHFLDLFCAWETSWLF